MDQNENLTVLGRSKFLYIFFIIFKICVTYAIAKDLLMVRFSFIQSDYLLTGRHLTILPLEPKLVKMLILAAIFNCLDPVLTVVTGLSVRDHFLMPLDKKDVS